MSDINSAIIERLERVVETLQENSVKMGQLLAVHNEKLDKQDKVDDRLRTIEKKMWSIAGGLVVISFILSVPGLQIMRNLTNDKEVSTISGLVVQDIERVR